MAHVPKERRIAFEDTSNIEFQTIFSSEHKTRQDVSGTYPGKAVPPESRRTWDLCPIGIEIKCESIEDLINNLHAFKRGDLHLAQIAKNGQNILAASGACFCFVVGVYGDMARIVGLTTRAQSSPLLSSLDQLMFSPDFYGALFILRYPHYQMIAYHARQNFWDSILALQR